MSEEFNGVGHAYLRSGQWFAVRSVGGGASVTLTLDDDGNIRVTAMDRHGGATTSVTFGPDGKARDA